MRKKFLLMLTLLIIALGGSGKLFAQVAKVGNTPYATIDEAIANWTNGTTLTLLADVTLSDVIKLNSDEYHILDLGTYTMTAASGKDAIQYVVKGQSTLDYALDIKAVANNPGGITATGKAIVVHEKPKENAPSKDRPITRFYGGVFEATDIVKQYGWERFMFVMFREGIGYSGASAPSFQFYGGEFNGNISTNRSLNQFYGGIFNGQLWMSVDSSAYTLIAGGTFKNLSNLYNSALNSEKFTIGSGKGVYDKEVYIDDNGNYVIAAAEPAEGIEADVAKTPGTDDYLAYSKVATEGKLNYTDVEVALKNNNTTSAKVTVYAEEVDMTGITFKGTIVVPAESTLTITNAPANLKVTNAEGEAITPNANGTYSTIPPVAKVGEESFATLSEAFAAVTDDNQTVVVLQDVTENLTSTLRGNITTENGAKVTITLTNSDWVSCPYTFVVGKNITLNVPALFYYAGGTQINGTVVAGAYYQRYAGTKLTINEPGSMTVTSETCIIRYMDGDPNAGIYVVGDNNPSTIGLKLSVAYFYQGMINAKDANIETGTYWQTNDTDGQGSANLVLDNSKLVVSVYDHPAKATGNSTVTLTNGSVIDAKNGGFTYGDNTTLSVDATSRIIGKDGEDVKLPVAQIGTTNYKTLAEAVNAVQEGQTITIFAGEISEGTIKLPSTLKNVKFLGAAEHATVLKDMTIIAADGNSVHYEGLTFDGITFDNSNVVLTGWRTDEVVYKDITVTNCIFKNIVRTSNEAAFHINCGEYEAVNGFTFTNNVIDGVSGASNSGVYAQLTGNVTFTGNVINNVAFRPYVIQLTTDDGVADTFTVKGNTFSGSKAGRAQGLGNNAEGTDNVNIVVSNNIFKGITDAQQICYWNFNAAKTTAVLSGNYYDIDVLANPGKIYFNTSAQGVGDLVEMGIFPYYTELNANGTINTESEVQVPAAIAKIGEKNYYSLQKALNDATAGTGNVTVEILDNINLTGNDWNPVTVSAPGYPVVTVEGNDKTITGLNDMLFAGTWAGNSGLIIKNLTIENSTIENDKNDAAGNVGVGAFVGFPQASSVITLDNCHLVNSTVEGGHWTGGLIGYAAGYAGTDGPVFMNLTIKGCSVTGSTITGKGSVGGIIGHGSGNAWTMVEIKGTTVSGNTITSTGTSVNKAGAVMGTIGAAGQATTVNGVEKQGGALVDATVSGNTVTSHGTAITTIYGRQGTNTGVLELNGGSYDNYPIEKGVAYAKPIEGFVIKENANGTFGVKSFEGEGTAEKPYMINDLEELIAFRNSVNSGAKTFSAPGVYVTLGADIDLNNEEWTPIGNITYDSKYVPVDASKVFSGIFDGKGKTISNLNVSSNVGGADEDANLGLFGITGAGAVIKNLTLTNVNINTDGRNVGAIAGFAYKATLSNIKVNGDIQIKGGNNVSGVAGMTRYYAMSATNITVSGANGSAIVGNNIVGGIFAEIAPNGSEQNFDGLHVENIAITGVGGVGGIVGLLTQGTVKNVSVKNVVLTGRTDYQGNAMGRIRLGSVSGLMGGSYAIIADETIENVTAKNLDGNAVELPVIGANYDASSNATEAKIGDKYYATFAAAYKVAQAGDVINLFADIEATEVILLDKSLTINGNGHKVTSSANRVFRVTAAAEVTLNNVNMVSTAFSSYTSDIRGISLDGGVQGVIKLTLNNCSVDFDPQSGSDWAYAVNITGNSSGYTLAINGGTYEGANVINVWGDNHVITIDGATLNNLYNAPQNGYYGQCVRFEGTGCTTTIKNTVFNGEHALAIGEKNTGANTVAQENNIDNTKRYIVKVGTKYYHTFADAFAAAVENSETIKVVNSFAIDTETFTVAKDKKVTLDLNGSKITVTDNKAGNNTQANYELFYILGEMTVTGNGTIELTATNNREWNASSSIFHNRGGVLNIENGTFKHLGGTEMAYVIDNSGNWAPDATTNVKGGEIASSYIGIRNRMDKSDNSGKAILNVSGGKISGTKRAIWAQASSSSETAPAKGEINVSGGEVGLIETARNATAQSMTTVTGGTVEAFKGEAGELKVKTGGTVATVTIYDAAGNEIAYAVNSDGLYIAATEVKSSGTWGGIDWSLTYDGTLTIAPTAGTPVPDKNAPTKRTYEVGEWREAVVYNSKGSASSIGGYPYDVKLVKKLVIKEGVTKIGSFTAQFPNLTGEVVIPSTVTYIGQEAFVVSGSIKTQNITKLTFAEGGTAPLCIANGAFKRIKIEEVSFPGDREYIHLHHWIFGDCPNLKYAYIPKNVTKSWGGEHVDYFDNFNSQSNVTWAEYGSIFTGCTKMETIEFENKDVRDLFFAKNRQSTDKDYIVAAADLVAYNTFDEALAEIKNGGDLLLVKDCDLKESLTIPADWTFAINLNGRTLSHSNACTASYEMINNKGNLIITGKGKLSFTDTSAGDPSFGWGSYTVRNEGNLVVENATIEHKGAQEFAKHMICAIFQYSGSTTINGGTISTPNYRSARLWKGDMTINGGTFDGQVWVQAVDNSANLTINGGTFSPKGNDLSSVFVSNDTYNVALAVTDGTFNGKVGCSNATKLAGTITGGKFTETAKNGTDSTLLATGLTFGEADAKGYYAVEDDPTTHYIKNVEELVAFRDAVNNGVDYFEGVTVYLAADLDLTGINWVGIGSMNKDHGFMGNFDGQGYKIKNLTITDPTLDSDGYAYAGFFGLTEGVDKDHQNFVKNLIIENVKIETTGHIAAAAIAYAYYTIVDNVKVCGNIAITGGDYTAGVLAYTRRCVNASNLTVIGNENSFVKGNQVVGGVISDIQMNGGLTAVYSDFSAEGITVTGTKNVGGISGIIATQTLIGASVKNVTLSGNAGVGIVSGALGGTSTISDVVFENVTGATDLLGATYNGGAIEAKIGDTYYAALANALAANGEVTVELLAPVTIPAGETVVFNLNKKTVVATDNATGSYAMITNKGDLTIEGEGKLQLTATNDRDWNAYSSVISNTVGGKLTVNGGTIEHIGGTDMAYGIDNLTNGKGTYAETVVNGGTVKSTYRAIRQFLNGIEAQNILTVNGGTIEGANKSIWMQDPSKNANSGTLTVGAEAKLIGDAYLTVTAGSTEWPVEVAIAAAALQGESTVLTSNVPEEYIVKNNNGVWGVFDAVASANGVNYATLQDAINAGGEVVVLSDIVLTETVTVAKGQVVTLNLNGKTISAAITEQLTKSFAAICNKGTLTVKDSATTRAAGKITVSYEGASFGYGVGLYTISNEGGTLNIESGIVENTTTVSGSMYDAIDNNSTLGETVLNITGGEVRCPGYIGIRQFANSTTHNNIVNVTGGKVVGGTSIWMQNPGSNQPKATIAISGDANIEGHLLADTSTGFKFDVTGGTFTTNVEDFCADDFSAVQTGPNTWVVKQTSGELTRTLPQGWSWFSSYVKIAGDQGLATLEAELGTSGIQIKDEAGRKFAQYSATSGWYGDLTSASSEKMYSIRTSAAVEVKLDGEFFGVENYEPMLVEGWNYMAYPHYDTLDLAKALIGFSPVEGDVIKSKTASAIYRNGSWYNAFKLTPGEGYMYRSKDERKPVSYTTEDVRSTAKAFVSETPEYWTADASQYSGNMTMIATLDVEGGDYEVAAFVDGEVRGSARPIYDEELNQYIVIMTINGENVANVTFKYYDLNAGEVYDFNNVVVYSDNAVLGSLEEPYALTRGTTGIGEATLSDINIYPNPTTTDREINLQATCDKVEVFNTLGVKVAEYENVDTIDALETAGTYVIRVTLNGDVKHCRLVVK